MDSNKFYCRNSTPVTSSTTSVASNGVGATTSQEYAASDSNYSAAAFNCKESVSRGNYNGGKSSHNNMRANNCSAAYGNAVSSSAPMSASTAGTVASSLDNVGHCSGSNGSGNYINVMSVPMGSLQYHRRKLTPQEYQSRLYHNTADYRCRDDFYSGNRVTAGSVGGSSVTGRISVASPSPSSIQMQAQGPQQHNHQTTHPQHHHHHHHQISQQASQHHYHHYNQPQQLTNSAVGIQQQQQHQQHNNTCSPTGATDPGDDTMNCSLALGNGQMVAATQTHQNSNCEQAVAPTSLAMSSLQSQVPPIMYTVHRVVTTAQIQTAGGNTFTSSSSVSSVVSAVRNEADSIGNVLTPVSSSSNPGCFVAGDISACTANIVPDANVSSNVTTGQPLLHNSPGLSTNANNYLTNQPKASGSAEVARSVPLGNASQTATGSFTNGVKATSSISRPLQNVIPTCVYLMSRVAVHMEIEGTAQCPSQVMLAAALGCEELGIANKLLAQSIFGLWMTSALLEIQLKSHHRPYVVRVAWPSLLEKFSHGNPIEKKYDEPMIMLKRNVFFSKRDEEKIKGQHKNTAQIAIFVAFMEKHPDLARGFVKGDRVHFEQLWVELTDELNASGPPKKETVAWKKVWSDLRLNVKQRLAHNKVEVSKTGGGLFNRYVMSPVDEQIAIICGLYTSVDGVQNSKSYGVPSKVKANKKVPSTLAMTSSSAKNSTLDLSSTPATTSTPTLAQCEELLQENESITVDLPVIEIPTSMSLSPTTSAWTSSRKRKRHIADVDDVLNMEAEHFSKMSANLVDIKVEMKENRRYLKEIALNIKDVRKDLKEIKILKEKELKEVTRHNFVIEKNLQTRNEIKMKFLELEEMRLGLKPSSSPSSS